MTAIGFSRCSDNMGVVFGIRIANMIFINKLSQQVNASNGTATMRLHIISQVIEHYHEFVKNYSEDPRYDFPLDHHDSQVDDPMGGEDGITHYDRFNLDPDFYNQD